ncbi:MAG: precorrin-3B C(17)-methyltransferase [Oscillatoriales cyanobacterium]|nr:MAG: precorrin-3B C(17)-methyltransferase [Oscillatoriales cyanobacterium]
MNRVPPAIIILGQNSLAIAQTISAVFCAAGIIIRTLAPLLSDKRAEPPVLAVAEDGSAVVPLLGGLHGVNDLAREIAAALGVQPAITTTGDIRFRTALLSPPQGYYLANPEDAKTFISNLLAGAKVQLEGAASWLLESNLPLAQPAPTGGSSTERIAPDAQLTIRVTAEDIVPTANRLVYHPQITAFALTNLSCVEPEIAVSYVQQILENADLAAASVAGFFALKHEMGNPTLEAISQYFKVPVRFLNLPELVEFDTVKLIQYNSSFEVTSAQIALTAAGANSQLIGYDRTNAFSCAIALASEPIDASAIGISRGKLAIVGTGPGGAPWMSPEVKEILREATDWVGYKFYLDLAGTRREGQNRHDSDNREEIDRARFALDLAASGKSVAVVSSGDPGIFAMAAAVFEAIDFDSKPEWEGIDIRVAPGISAMQAAAAAIGAPLGHDFCAISLSDILKPWEVIEQRIVAAASADLVMAFYNPISKQRIWQLKRAIEILLETRDAKTPVVLGRNLGRSGQSVRVCTLGEFQPEDADMRTLVIIGSSQTRIIPRKFGDIWVYTPRRYDLSL